MSLAAGRRASLIWATRGRSWGFRFLLNAGFPDPLAEYERAFENFEEAPPAWRLQAGRVALRLSDPLGRTDASSRTIPHDFVILGDFAQWVGSTEDGLREVWPLVASAYADVWDAAQPPSAADLRFGA